MAQTDDIHENFYDLFNQRFLRIDDTKGPRYYANIAIGAHSKPCRVHPEFQCVVVVKQSEVKNTPAPFLNRFEKYRLSHHALLEAALGMLPPCMAVVVNTVREKVRKGIRSGVVNHQNLGIRDGVSAAGNKGWGNTPLVPGDKHVHVVLHWYLGIRMGTWA